MAILTKPAVTKGAASIFTLSKTELSQVASVAANVYYSNTSNWKLVKISYHSSEGRQREVVLFDATQLTPTGQFLVSDKAKDIFEVRRIVIEDFDGGSFVINRTDLIDPETNFDISFIPTSPVPLLTRNYASPNSFQAWESSSEPLGGDISILSNKLSINLATYFIGEPFNSNGDFTGSYNINDLSAVGFNMQQNTNYTLEVDYTSISSNSAVFVIAYRLGTNGTTYNTFPADYSPSGGTLIIPLNPLNTAILFNSNLKIEAALSSVDKELSFNISEIRIYEA
jgi:hypothetical protein